MKPGSLLHRYIRDAIMMKLRDPKVASATMFRPTV